MSDTFNCDKLQEYVSWAEDDFFEFNNFTHDTSDYEEIEKELVDIKDSNGCSYGLCKLDENGIPVCTCLDGARKLNLGHRMFEDSFVHILLNPYRNQSTVVVCPFKIKFAFKTSIGSEFLCLRGWAKEFIHKRNWVFHIIGSSQSNGSFTQETKCARVMWVIGNSMTGSGHHNDCDFRPNVVVEHGYREIGGAYTSNQYKDILDFASIPYTFRDVFIPINECTNATLGQAPISKTQYELPIQTIPAQELAPTLRRIKGEKCRNRNSLQCCHYADFQLKCPCVIEFEHDISLAGYDDINITLFYYGHYGASDLEIIIGDDTFIFRNCHESILSSDFMKNVLRGCRYTFVWVKHGAFDSSIWSTKPNDHFISRYLLYLSFAQFLDVKPTLLVELWGLVRRPLEENATVKHLKCMARLIGVEVCTSPVLLDIQFKQNRANIVNGITQNHY